MFRFIAKRYTFISKYFDNRLSLIAKVMELDVHEQIMLKRLYLNGRMKKTEVYDKIPGGSTRTRKLDGLQKQGYVFYDVRRYENNTTYVELTEIGKKIAEHLVEIDKIVPNTSVEELDEHLEKIIEEEVQKRLKERLEEEDYISTPGAVLSVREKGKDQ